MVSPCLFFNLQKVSNAKFCETGRGILALVGFEVLSNGILAVDSEMCGGADLVDDIFGISGGSLSHSSSFMSKWLTVDLCARACN